MAVAALVLQSFAVPLVAASSPNASGLFLIQTHAKVEQAESWSHDTEDELRDSRRRQGRRHVQNRPRKLSATNGVTLSDVHTRFGWRKRRDVVNTGFFVDMTPYILPEQWYNWNHSGFPRSHQGTPSFPDFNGDGVLDYFYHNHYEDKPSTAWDVGVSARGAGYSQSSAFWKSVGEDVIACTEPIPSKWTQERAMDSHGTAIIDIDRDGLWDIYMAAGGGDGHVAGPAKNAVLLWGLPPGSNSSSLQRFAGGRHVAEAANLHNPDSRGRFNYFVDFNRDGLLDVVFSNEPRDDSINAFGFAMLNKGDRTFEPHYALSEYAETMVLHDADGDGHADEFVVQRRDCTPKKCKYEGHKGCKMLQKLNSEWYEFCRVRVEGTTAIYKYDASLGKLVLITPPDLPSDVLLSKDHGRSMQTGDFDGDGLADLVVLYGGSVRFYYSSRRALGELPIGNASEEIMWNQRDCDGQALRVADLDLDGDLDMMVLCYYVQEQHDPAHRLYLREEGQWVLKDDKNEVGDLLNSRIVHPTLEQLQEVCYSGQEYSHGYLKKMCDQFTTGDSKGHLTVPRAMGMSLVDIDNDGFLDLALSYDLGNMLLLHNNFVARDHVRDNGFIAFKLRGTVSNEYGIGATVLLQARGMGTYRNETTVQLREVYSYSHETDWFGTRDDRIIFGLGPLGIPERVTVRWPGKGDDRRVQQIDDEHLLRLHANSMTNFLRISEDLARDATDFF